MEQAKKSLGQHFLIDKNIRNKIIKLINFKNEKIIEIGPGKGFLTEEILIQKPKKLILIEKDFNDQQATEITFLARGDMHLAMDISNKNDKDFLEDLRSISKQFVTVNETNWRKFIDNLTMLAFRDPNQFRFKIFLLQLWFNHAYRIRMSGSPIQGFERLEESLSEFNEKYPNANLMEINRLLEDSIESLSKNFYTPLMLTNLLISVQTLLRGKELQPVL